VALACVVPTALALPPAAAEPPVSPPPALLSCRDGATAALPAVARDALLRIGDSGRQLLALRSYLRARDLEQRWSWSDARIRAYAGSAEQQHAQAEVARVQARFAADNPGYGLHVNLQVRSLDEQLRKWNGNASVGAAASALSEEAAGVCAHVAADFAGWLRAWAPPSPVNLAAPGLSPHGQGRAYDFQVMQGERLVAGTDSGRAEMDWIDAGWASRLVAAMRDSGARFEGPLRSPSEPWHYAYVPVESAQ